MQRDIAYLLDIMESAKLVLHYVKGKTRKAYSARGSSMKSTIDQLIINSPYEEPKHYWSYDRETRLFSLKEGRRPAGYGGN